MGNTVLHEPSGLVTRHGDGREGGLHAGSVYDSSYRTVPSGGCRRSLSWASTGSTIREVPHG